MVGLRIASASEKRGQEEVAAEPGPALLNTENKLSSRYIISRSQIYLGSQKRIQVLHMLWGPTLKWGYVRHSFLSSLIFHLPGRHPMWRKLLV